MVNKYITLPALTVWREYFYISTITLLTGSQQNNLKINMKSSFLLRRVALEFPPSSYYFIEHFIPDVLMKSKMGYL